MRARAQSEVPVAVLVVETWCSMTTIKRCDRG